ncbi:MAG: class I SAM-dependent methyltransferase [Blastocatellia bacterium]|nr:class I SAM-dependent methyltransferase [Blastocatellia bacterium]
MADHKIESMKVPASPLPLPPPHPDWKFQYISEGCPIYFDPRHDLYHSIIPVSDPTLLYQEQFYEAGSGARFFSPVEAVTRFFRRRRARYIARFARTGGGVLDIGCGNGYILYYLREDHHISPVIGTQVSATAQAFAQKTLGVTVKLGELPELIPELPQFCVITAWHVFEHVADYETYFKLSWDLLFPGGYLILEVPNAKSWTVPFSKEGWMGWDPPQHVVHFTPEGMKKILLRYGFEIVSQNTFSLEYSVFTSLQSICNRFSHRRNAFYDGLRRVGGNHPPLWLVLGQGVLFSVLFLPVFLINLLFNQTGLGEVLHVVARKPTDLPPSDLRAQQSANP